MASSPPLTYAAGRLDTMWGRASTCKFGRTGQLLLSEVFTVNELARYVGKEHIKARRRREKSWVGVRSFIISKGLAMRAARERFPN
jgi:hypothetical protein